ncbi:MAG: DUF4173 domain-containing protein [Gemmatimonadota bacterium]|nr:DUF4173 domain-containing protein [Gemmatimonadota bacterium]MDH3368588.1 DUF4173 domain-containing protein [Gemmatimonadota bacterium]MDH3478382.1 DUF4173 domain-containing protein [Gemmatimonadota bacterium]MDH3571507.1 DUF4173 domain-containing protein [Gemmatimonadota bacterium]MDH5548930.1 DUF4173 domain-containing protein [Gemmatimonadota bacterium]
MTERDAAPPEVLPWLLATAVALGVLGDVLLRGVPWGVNAVLWTAAVAVATAGVLASVRPDAVRSTLPLLLAAIFFSGCIAWRDAGVLATWNGLATVLALGLGLLRGRRFSLAGSTIGEYVRDGVAAGVRLIAAPLSLLGSGWGTAPASPRRRSLIRRTAVGLLLALPVMLVFGALLASADPIFERAVRWLIDWDFEQLVSHLVLTAVLSWLAGGLLLTIAASGPLWPFADKLPRRPGLGLVEVGIPLAALAVLFALFVVVQFRYLFGGEDLVRATIGLTYADYARRGFFELVTATALVIPLLVAGDWFLDDSDGTIRRRFRWLAALLLALVALIMVSAAERLRLYVGTYGLTDTRVYAAAVMLWVGTVLAWFGATVLRGHRERFVVGSVVAGFVMLAMLNGANPDALVARTNLGRAAAGAELDLTYVARLGADAVPVLLEQSSELPDDTRCAIVALLAAKWNEVEDRDWRTWNVARYRAARIVGESPIRLSPWRSELPPACAPIR